MGIRKAFRECTALVRAVVPVVDGGAAAHEAEVDDNHEDEEDLVSDYSRTSTTTPLRISLPPGFTLSVQPVA